MDEEGIRNDELGIRDKTTEDRSQESEARSLDKIKDARHSMLNANSNLPFESLSPVKPSIPSPLVGEGKGEGDKLSNPRPLESLDPVSSDSLHPVSSESSNPVPTGVDPLYTYDLNGNRITMTDSRATTTYGYNILNISFDNRCYQR